MSQGQASGFGHWGRLRDKSGRGRPFLGLVVAQGAGGRAVSERGAVLTVSTGRWDSWKDSSIVNEEWRPDLGMEGSIKNRDCWASLV